MISAQVLFMIFDSLQNGLFKHPNPFNRKAPLALLPHVRYLSVEPDTMMLPTIWLLQTPPVWPTRVRRHLPVTADQTCGGITRYVLHWLIELNLASLQNRRNIDRPKPTGSIADLDSVRSEHFWSVPDLIKWSGSGSESGSDQKMS